MSKQDCSQLKISVSKDSDDGQPTTDLYCKWLHCNLSSKSECSSCSHHPSKKVSMKQCRFFDPESGCWLGQDCVEEDAREKCDSFKELTVSKIRSAEEALAINEGACNGRGISKSLAAIYDAFQDEGTSGYNGASPVRLILHQLCHLAGMASPLGMLEYSEIVRDCEFLAKLKIDETV